MLQRGRNVEEERLAGSRGKGRRVLDDPLGRVLHPVLEPPAVADVAAKDGFGNVEAKVAHLLLELPIALAMPIAARSCLSRQPEVALAEVALAIAEVALKRELNFWWIYVSEP